MKITTTIFNLAPASTKLNQSLRRFSPYVRTWSFLALAGAILSSLAAEDLGTITEGTAIELTPCRRRGAAWYEVAILSPSKTNVFTTTNAVITLKDFGGMPNGLATLRVQSYCENGERSPVSEFLVNLNQTRAPAAPKAKVVQLVVDPDLSLPVMPPMPVIEPEAEVMPSAVPLRNPGSRAHFVSAPLPSSTNYSSYQEFKVRVDEALKTGRRRNQ